MLFLHERPPAIRRDNIAYNGMKTLYFDCFAGASGDMILGGLVGLGVDPVELTAALKGLGTSGWELRCSTVDRSGIGANRVEVITEETHAHRHLSGILRVIDAAALSPSVKTRAGKIFTRLAEAESRVHQIPVERIHFHEVGALDAIVDIVGACVGFEMLGIERFLSSPLHVGSGFVEMVHGKFPVPPTAVTCGLVAISLGFLTVPVTQLRVAAEYWRPAAPQSPEATKTDCPWLAASVKVESRPV
jgi:uncharacterized protein (DUF111 family)